MKSIKYFIQFLIILTLFLLFKVLGLKFASFVSSKIVSFVGPFFRSKKVIRSNILKAFRKMTLRTKQMLKTHRKMTLLTSNMLKTHRKMTLQTSNIEKHVVKLFSRHKIC